MADQDETETDERDEEESDRDSEDEVESEPAPKVEAKARAKQGSQRGARPGSAPAKAQTLAGTMPSSRAGLLIVLALVAGGAAGWFGQIAQAKAVAQKADAAAPTGSVASGPCATWEEKICSGGGKQSAACQQAKGATELLTPSTCQAGLLAMPATLTKLKAARANCEKLVTKLCADLPPGSQACGMVKERTPQFPPKRCDDMLQHYDEVIASLKQLDQQQGGMHMGGPGGPGGPGPVMPPH